jgi:hypothetical protein
MSPRATSFAENGPSALACARGKRRVGRQVARCRIRDRFLAAHDHHDGHQVLVPDSAAHLVDEPSVQRLAGIRLHEAHGGNAVDLEHRRGGRARGPEHQLDLACVRMVRAHVARATLKKSTNPPSRALMEV